MDLSKFLEWTATWQNALAFVLASGFAFWVTYDPDGGSTAGDFLLILLLGLAAVRVLIVLCEALWKRFVPRRPGRG